MICALQRSVSRSFRYGDREIGEFGGFFFSIAIPPTADRAFVKLNRPVLVDTENKSSE